MDEFPLGQTSFHFSGFFECLLLPFSFLGVFRGGNGGRVGIAWLSQCARLGMESRVLLVAWGWCSLCAILDYRWSWQKEPPSLTQSNKFELFLPLNPSKEFLTRRPTGWLSSPFSDPAWVFRAENEHSSHNQSSAASWHSSPSKLKSMLNAQPRPEVKM